jgi:hypothetical protein
MEPQASIALLGFVYSGLDPVRGLPIFQSGIKEEL